MSIARALSNAMSGLTATARGTETVAANLANAMTPSYARREVVQTAQTLGGQGGGVRIEGIQRIVNTGLLAQSRLGEAARAEGGTRLTFLDRMEQAIGSPGAIGGLGEVLTNFRTALQSAASRPDDTLRLQQAVEGADRLADALNAASAEVQKARGSADQAIAADVTTLNEGLERVAALNRKIAYVQSNGGDLSSLLDQRQGVVDNLAHIVPLQEVARDNGQVALFTMEGAALLDGSRPAVIGFDPAGAVIPTILSLSRLTLNGTSLGDAQMRLFAGGSMGANFAIRDQLAPQLQAELDGLAFDLQSRLSDPATDPTVGAGQPGLFTDGGQVVGPADLVGLSDRLKLNLSLVPSKGGEVWRIRTGAAATQPGNIGDPTFLNAISAAIDRAAPSTTQPGLGNATLAGRFSGVESGVSARRVSAEGDLAVRAAQSDILRSGLAADSVDSDAEMQRLLQYETTYAANARVIQAIEDMMDQILRL